MIQIGKKSISLPVIIGMYLLIYNPPVFSFGIIRFNCIWPVGIFSAAWVLLNLKTLKEQMNLRAVVGTEIVLGVILAYLMGIAVLHHRPVSAFGYIVYWMAGDIPFAIACWMVLRKRGLGFPELLDHLLITGTVMALTAVAAFLIPAVNEFFTEIMVSYGIPYSVKLAPYRNFGLAANLTSTASYALAMISGIAFYRAVRGKPLWLIPFVLMAFGANINSRASIVLIPVGIAAAGAGALWSRDRKMILRFFAFAVPAAALAYFGLGAVRWVNARTYQWLTAGIQQIGSFAAGGETNVEAAAGSADGYFGELKLMFRPGFLPGGTDLVFGAGRSISDGIENGIHSDVGFVNDVWRGGLVYLFGIIALYLRTLWQMARSRTIRRHDGVFLALMLLGVFVITNIKGSFFIHSDVTAVVWLLVPALIWNKEVRG